MNLELKNKNVLVTGSNRGTGQIIAESFVREGANVFYHHMQEPTEGLAEDGIHTWGDITTDAGADQVLHQVKDEVDQLDILVNNYGKATRGKWQSARDALLLMLTRSVVFSACWNRGRRRISVTT